MEQLKCKLAEYAILYSAKIMWGLDCDIKELLLEIAKLQMYVSIKKSLETSNTCTNVISVNLIQKIDSYIASLNRSRNLTCRNCN